MKQSTFNVNLVGNGDMTGVRNGKLNNNAVFNFGTSNELFAVDMGFTYLQAMHQANIPLVHVKYAFFTHFDGDHVGGITQYAQTAYWNFTANGHEPHRLTIFVMPGQEEKIRAMVEPILNAQGLVVNNYLEFVNIVDNEFTIEDYTLRVIDTKDLHCDDMQSYALHIIHNESGENMVFSSDIKKLEESGLRELVDEKTVAVFQDTAFPNNPVHAGFEEILAYYPKSVHSLLQLMHLPANAMDYQKDVSASGATFTQQGVWCQF